MTETAQQALSLLVDTARQRLQVLRHGQVLREYPVSTGSAGTGQRSGSGCTPLGEHRI